MKRSWLLVIVPLFALVLTSCSSSSPGQATKSDTIRARTLMIVGDSVAVQASAALTHLAPKGTVVSVEAVRGGSAPCDWVHGLTDPATGAHVSFSSVLAKVRPAAVAFLFTGNPGLGGPSAGCVNANEPYSFSQLLASYEPALTSMADQAVAQGAQVYFEAPPPRNPAVPPGWNAEESADGGYQGVPQMASFYQRLASTHPTHWHYDDSAGVAVSTSELAWRLTLPCQAWSEHRCADGQVQVRVGGADSVHLDVQGCGAIFLALAVEEHIFGTAQPDPRSVAAAAASYGGCQEPDAAH